MGIGGLLIIHLLLNIVHKYPDIYDAVGLWVFKGVVVVERVYSVCISVNTYIHTNMLTNIHSCL